MSKLIRIKDDTVYLYQGEEYVPAYEDYSCIYFKNLRTGHLVKSMKIVPDMTEEEIEKSILKGDLPGNYRSLPSVHDFQGKSEVEKKKAELEEYRKRIKDLKWTPANVKSDAKEYFRFLGYVWDVDSLQKRVKELGLEPQEISLKGIESLIGFLGVDKASALKSTRTDPIIMVELLPKQMMIVDGLHRAYRDIEFGKKSTRAYIVPFYEQVKYLIEETMFDRIIKEAVNKLTM